MKKLTSLSFALVASAVWAIDPIRVNFSASSSSDVDGWQNVRYADLANGVTCANGVALTLSGSKGWYYHGVHPEGLQHDYIDDDNYTNPTVLTFAGLPAGVYSVTVYLGADYGTSCNPIAFNETYYSYVDGELKATKAAWGNPTELEPQVGVNIMKVPSVFVMGEAALKIKTCRDFGRGSVAAVEIADYPFADGGTSVISVNVASDNLKSYAVAGSEFVSGLAGGEIPAGAWLNVSHVSNAFSSVAYWDGAAHTLVAETGVGVTVTAGGCWQDGNATGANAFLKGYLDDNSAPSIAVTGIPFPLYDVLVYMNNDWNNGTHKAFNPVTVNGVAYSWDEATETTIAARQEWGVRGIDVAALGTNALRIAGLMDPAVVVSTGSRQTPARGGLAAVQVVAHACASVVATGDISTQEINARAGDAKEVVLNLPAGATLTVSRTALACDSLFVVSEGDVRLATWNNVAPQDDPQAESVAATNFAKIDTKNVKGLVFHGWKPTKRIISLNVNAEKGAMSDVWAFDGGLAAEEIPSAAWNNLVGASGADDAPVVWNGDLLTTQTVDGVSVTWEGAVYGWGSAPEAFRRGWFDGSQRSGTVTVSGIPFTRYDVIVYANWDGGSHAYGAPWINGKQWHYDAEAGRVVEGDARWGDNDNEALAQLNVNALRIPDQADSTCVVRTGGYCGNVCAIQIVEYCPPAKAPRGLVMIIR